jgi:hypothetical protein
MAESTNEPVFYASRIVVKAVTDENGEFFELDIEYGAPDSWFSTEQMPRQTVDAIRAASVPPANVEGITFVLTVKQQESSVRFLVDHSTRIHDEWSW